MSNIGKIIIIVLVLLLSVSIYFAIFSLQEKQTLEKVKLDLENKIADYEIQKQKIIKENKGLKNKAKETENKNSELRKDLEVISARIETLNKQVDNLQEEKDKWERQIAELRRERDKLLVKVEKKPEPVVIYEQVEKEEPSPESLPKLSEEGTGDRYWAEILKKKMALELEVKRLKNELSEYSGQVETLKGENSRFQSELGLLKSEKEEVERRMGYKEDLSDNLSVELARARNEQQFDSEMTEQLKKENRDLRFKVKDLTNTKIVLEKNIAQLKDESNMLEKRLITTEHIVQTRLNDVLGIEGSLEKIGHVDEVSSEKEEVDLPPIVVNASEFLAKQDAGSLSILRANEKDLDGSIVSINEENNFVVVDLGENSGIRLGDRMFVFRGDQYIAELEVINVREGISAADIITQEDRIKIGDYCQVAWGTE